MCYLSCSKISSLCDDNNEDLSSAGSVIIENATTHFCSRVAAAAVVVVFRWMDNQELNNLLCRARELDRWMDVGLVWSGLAALIVSTTTTTYDRQPFRSERKKMKKEKRAIEQANE